MTTIIIHRFFVDVQIHNIFHIGMAKWTRPAGTRPDPTLMGRVLSDPFNIRVGSGFSLKKPEAGSGRVRVLGIPDLNPTRIYNI